MGKGRKSGTRRPVEGGQPSVKLSDEVLDVGITNSRGRRPKKVAPKRVYAKKSDLVFVSTVGDSGLPRTKNVKQDVTDPDRHKLGVLSKSSVMRDWGAGFVKRPKR